MSEADRIYRAIFNEAAPKSVVDIYQRALASLEPHWLGSALDSASGSASGSLTEWHWAERALARAIHPESLEFACRLLGRHRALSQRFRLMVLCAETEAELDRHFRIGTAPRRRVFFELLAMPLMAMVKLPLGLAQLLTERFWNAA